MQRALREGCAQQISIDGKGALLVQRALSVCYIAALMAAMAPSATAVAA